MKCTIFILRLCVCTHTYADLFQGAQRSLCCTLTACPKPYISPQNRASRIGRLGLVQARTLELFKAPTWLCLQLTQPAVPAGAEPGALADPYRDMCCPSFHVRWTSAAQRELLLGHTASQERIHERVGPRLGPYEGTLSRSTPASRCLGIWVIVRVLPWPPLFQGLMCWCVDLCMDAHWWGPY